MGAVPGRGAQSAELWGLVRGLVSRFAILIAEQITSFPNCAGTGGETSPCSYPAPCLGKCCMSQLCVFFFLDLFGLPAPTTSHVPRRAGSSVPGHRCSGVQAQRKLPGLWPSQNKDGDAACSVPGGFPSSWAEGFGHRGAGHGEPQALEGSEEPRALCVQPPPVAGRHPWRQIRAAAFLKIASNWLLCSVMILI